MMINNRRSYIIHYLFVISTIHFQVESFILQPFYWNRTTFSPIEDGTLLFEVRLGDVMDLICPYYDQKQYSSIDQLEQFDIYRVTQKEFNQCALDQTNINTLTRLVITCQNPFDLMKYTLNFRSYLPIPNGFEFRANQTYFFLSNSSERRRSCHRLKIIVNDHHRPSTIAPNDSTFENQENPQLLLHHHQRITSTINTTIDIEDIQRPPLYSLKAQRHSASTISNRTIIKAAINRSSTKCFEFGFLVLIIQIFFI